MSSRNPFDLVKATDLDDRQIAAYWVDMPAASSLVARVKPTSPMPMFVLGGKGSGKTHLLRYLSAQLQQIRHSSDVSAGLAADSYIGIYLHCGDLNAGRFKDKDQPDSAWASVFEYFMELWIAQL